MGAFVVEGGIRLRGCVGASGGKNAALPLLAATLLTREEVEIRNCPDITDVSDMTDILSALGARVKREGSSVLVCAREMDAAGMPEELSHKIRSSIFLLGSILARANEACFFAPGGCEIGRRPIDQHIRALEVLGVSARQEDGKLICRTDGLKGGRISLSFPSVGATENAILAATLAEGETVIEGAAREPEICCLAGMLRAMGARISGEGSTRIAVCGVKRLSGVSFECMSDRIEAPTLLAAAAATRGSVTITRTDPSCYESITDLMSLAGADIRVYKDTVSLKMQDRPKAFSLVTQPYPGFPTDMQAQMCALACTAKGDSYIKETVFENRLKHVFEMEKTGVRVIAEGGTVRITGKERLKGCKLEAADLRAGAALTILALACEGKSTVTGTRFIDRGYESLEKKLRLLGGKIERI